MLRVSSLVSSGQVNFSFVKIINPGSLCRKVNIFGIFNICSSCYFQGMVPEIVLVSKVPVVSVPDVFRGSVLGVVICRRGVDPVNIIEGFPGPPVPLVNTRNIASYPVKSGKGLVVGIVKVGCKSFYQVQGNTQRVAAVISFPFLRPGDCIAPFSSTTGVDS